MQLGRDDRRDRLPHDLARGPAEHRFGGRVERADRAVGTDGENPFGRVLDHRAVVRFAALRVVSRRGGLAGLLGELTLGPFLVLEDRSGHTDRDREHEGAETSDRLRLRPAQERRRPTLEHQHLTDRGAGQRPAERRSPRPGAGLLEIGQRRERERHPQRRAPAAHVHDRGDGDHVSGDANVEPQRTGRRPRSPAFEEHPGERDTENHPDVRPDRAGDELEMEQHHQHDEGNGPDHIREERRRQSVGLGDRRRGGVGPARLR